jgi:hypothetical protein
MNISHRLLNMRSYILCECENKYLKIKGNIFLCLHCQLFFILEAIAKEYLRE